MSVCLLLVFSHRPEQSLRSLLSFSSARQWLELVEGEVADDGPEHLFRNGFETLGAGA